MPRFVDMVSIETPYGERRFCLYSGDVLEAEADLIAFSSHAQPDLELTGLVLSAFAEKFGVSVEARHLEGIIMTRGVAGTYRLRASVAGTTATFLVVRMPGQAAIELSGERLDEVYERHVWSLFGSVSALELKGEVFKRMALPLLGGQRGYEPRVAIRTLLDQARNWLERSRVTEEVGLYLADPQMVPQWEEALNAVTDRQVVRAARNELVQALAKDTLDLAAALRILDPSLARPIDRLVMELREDRPVLHRVAMDGRYLAETVVDLLCDGLGVKKKRDLIHKIEDLPEVVPPWIKSYLHNLRVFGNEEAHRKDAINRRPGALEEGDLVAVLSSILRILAFWRDYRPSVPSHPPAP